MVIQGMTKIGFDKGLAADIQFVCDIIELFQHNNTEIYINPMK